MSASNKAKQLGLKNLTQVSQLTGVSLQTLTNWYNNKTNLFLIVLIGCLKMINKDKALTLAKLINNKSESDETAAEMIEVMILQLEKKFMEVKK